MRLAADESAVRRHVHNRPQGRGNDRLEHRQNPSDHHCHENYVGQAGQKNAKVESHRLDVRGHHGKLLDRNLDHPIPDRRHHLVEIEAGADAFDG